jgi:hypothetical protein
MRRRAIATTTWAIATTIAPLVIWWSPLMWVIAYEWSSAGSSRPAVDRKAIAGIWKLTPIPAMTDERPMKEFTVYPKKQNPDCLARTIPDVLLMLNEDGSFKKYGNNDNDQDEGGAMGSARSKDVDTSWSFFQLQQLSLFRFLKGTWAYRDGQLLLAADRDDTDDPMLLYHTLADGYVPPAMSSSAGITTATTSTTTKQDTLLKGRLVATYVPRLSDNPVLSNNPNSNTNSTSTALSTKNPAIDTHLSVPKGYINVGKFFYPKNHPSFFDQPMFQPVKKGTFALRQILGSLNARRDEDVVVEKFKRSDFYNKTFLLTSHPLGQRPPPGNKRWSIKYNTYVYDPPSKTAAKAAEEANQRNFAAAGIRVLQLTFHANNTFSTTAGLGTSAILRGKFDVIGTEKDQLWMQVIRFGFGRSVSGSVYSEGPMLSHEDAKAYWGTIAVVPENLPSRNGASALSNEGNVTSESNSDSNAPPKRLEVVGSVLDGWGLEPSPVARFILRETTTLDGDTDAMDDEDDDDELVEETGSTLDNATTKTAELEDDGVDWSSNGSDSFQ